MLLTLLMSSSGTVQLPCTLSKLYAAKILMLSIARYCYDEKGDMPASFLLSDTNNVDERIDLFNLYAAGLLRLISEPFCMMAWLILRSLEYAVPLRTVWWPQCRPRSLYTRFRSIFGRIYPQHCHHCLFMLMFQSCLYRIELNRLCPSFMMLEYCALLHWCTDSNAGQRCKPNEAVWRNNNFYIVLITKTTVGLSCEFYDKTYKCRFISIVAASRPWSWGIANES